MEYKIGMLDCKKSRNSEAFLVKTQNNQYMIDTGYINAFKSLKELHMFTCGSNSRLNYLIISHGDSDHCSNIVNIANYFIPNFIVFSPIHMYKSVLLKKFSKFKFSGKGTSFDLISKILSCKNYKKFYRILSNSNNKNLNQVYPNYYKNYQLDLEVIKLEEGVNQYFDIILGISNQYLEDKRVTTIKNDIKALINANSLEFETYDTGQTEKIEQSLSNLIMDIQDRTISTNTTNKKDFKKLLDKIKEYGLIDYNEDIISIDKDIFINLFKMNILKKINNAMSLIVRINDTLFTGDSEIEQLEAVLEILNKSSINIIKVPHHGSIKNHFPKLYQKFHPKLCLLKSSTKTSNQILKLLMKSIIFIV